MLDTLAKNLWLLITVGIPGMFTYGVWRVLLLLEPSNCLDTAALNQIDGSAIASASIIIAVGLLQQSVGITIESLLAFLAKKRQQEWPNIYSLFCERFELAAAGKLDENGTRIIGNFFQSMNISVGLFLVLLYFMAYEGMEINEWIPTGIIFFIVAALISTVFRMLDAKWVIEKCR